MVGVNLMIYIDCVLCSLFFFQQSLGLQTHKLPEHDPSLKYQVAIFLDEVASLGKIPILAKRSVICPAMACVSRLSFIRLHNYARCMAHTMPKRC